MTTSGYRLQVPHRRSAIAAILAAFLTLYGCERQNRMIVIDDWYIADFSRGTCQRAKANLVRDADIIRQFGCSQVTSCSETTAIAEACATTDGVSEARAFERAIEKELAINRECTSVKVFVYSGPKESTLPANVMLGPHWTLIVDFIPGSSAQNWWISESDTPSGLDGKGSAEKIAKDICAIVSRRGAEVKT